ncbi:4Fe-4S binding protein [Haloimpatiens massiliensis]|uniref:4Fe-4S binding protein n=1 Tax=Haloimpatiens massiliensis TaxID=1658110 RepID=UPI000C81DF4D|nr:4Fe-4S binding protein [Haloimpatiens massiliensis]
MKKRNYFKWVISIFFLIFAPVMGYMHQVKGGGPSGSPSVDALCPFGGLETLFSLIKDGAYIKRIAPSSLIILICLIVLTILLGRIFCGYICPLGTIQTLINKLGRKLKIKQIKVNEKMDKILRYSKYVVLVVVLFTTYKAGELILRPLDPWATFMHLGSGSEIFSEFLIGFIILMLIFMSSLFIERAWCRYFCPLGAFLAIISPLRIFKVKRNPQTCVNCKKCTKNCPMGIEISNCNATDSMECISCGECLAVCPKSETLDMKKGKKKLSLSAIGAVVTLVVILVIGGNVASGKFEVAQGNTETLTQNGVLNPDNIRGYMTLNDICKEFKIESSILLKECGLPEDTDLNKPIKELKTDLEQKDIEFETENLRDAIKKILEK